MTAVNLTSVNVAEVARMAGSVPSARQMAKSEKAAREFEALLLAPVLDSLRKSFSGASDAAMPGADDYRAMATHALAEAIADRGGIGIARLVRNHLEPPKVSGSG